MELTDITQEADWFEKAYQRVARSTEGLNDRALVWSRSLPVVSTRSGGGKAGLEVAPRLSATSQTRLRTLLFLEDAITEQSAPPELDRGVLALLACQILEEHLRGAIVPAAGELGERLARSLAGSSAWSQKVLAGWRQGKVPPTFGVLAVLFEAHRKAAELFDADELVGRFEPPYRTLLLERGFERCVETIRSSFRNELSHGIAAVLDEDRYEKFSSLVVGTRAFATWYRGGPPTKLSSQLGLLHHHLALALGA